ncbi:MAG TPA: LLM class flavin-dependent oxidoreductase [Caulobacteraceae bacterium]|jgi:alkanesulfonate monooxygenase SsuD/methylene tetrahydromethanopterin reductase-like flavin-dependent oxidoreductase (luciferase family)|nr:LLM class flavin-dependent oxidoreductase [Caulobacteraceae bacterium]
MKTCFLGTGGYVGEVHSRAWPVPPEQCSREEAMRSMDTAIRQYKLAEEVGFDWVSISEHHYSPGLMTPNPGILAAAISQQTSRVKIALLGPLVPLINPVRTAEEIAMLDALSHGRVVVLFLKGTPNEHATYGTNPAETREITQEGVQLIMRAWTEPQPFSWEGKFFRFRTVSVWPRTVQDPHPPIFYSGNSDESAEFAGKHGLSIAIGFAPPPRVKQQVDIYKRAAREAGWEPTHDNVLYRGRMIIGETDAAAEEIANRIGIRTGPAAPGGGQGGGDPTAGVAGVQLLGGLETVLAKAKQLHEAGVGILDVGVAGGGMTRSLELFGKRFAPALAELV